MAGVVLYAMPFIGSTPPFAQQEQQQPAAPTVQDYVNAKWEIMADGPSGTQLRAPRKLSTLDTIAAVIGCACVLFLPPVGVFILICVMIDYLWLSKRDTVFIPR